MRCRGPATAVQGYRADCPGELAAGTIGSHTLSVLPPVQDTGWKSGCPAPSLARICSVYLGVTPKVRGTLCYPELPPSY